MTKDKRKRILALILSGVLLVGNANPVTTNAAESPDEIEVHTQLSEEGLDSETDAVKTGAGENAAEESSVKESTAEESTSEESANKESIIEESIIEESTDNGNTDERNTVGESSVNEDVSEEDMTEDRTATEMESETESETETDETEEETQEEGKVLESDRQIAENLLKDYNTSFEGVDGDGKLWWWNDLEWGKDENLKVVQKSYGDGEKPSSDCGESYLEVTSKETKSGAQICDNKIATLIKPEITYEFSYFAKLSEGQDSGEVQFQINSIAGDWSSTKNAEVKLDSDMTLDAVRWKQISGTFKLPAHDKHEQVAIKFTGSDGLSFCIDDLRVAAVDDENTGGGEW